MTATKMEIDKIKSLIIERDGLRDALARQVQATCDSEAMCKELRLRFDVEKRNFDRIFGEAVELNQDLLYQVVNLVNALHESTVMNPVRKSHVLRQNKKLIEIIHAQRTVLRWLGDRHKGDETAFLKHIDVRPAVTKYVKKGISLFQPIPWLKILFFIAAAGLYYYLWTH